MGPILHHIISSTLPIANGSREDHQGSDGRLWQYRGHLCVGVLGKASIQNGIRDLRHHSRSQSPARVEHTMGSSGYSKFCFIFYQASSPADILLIMANTLPGQLAYRDVPH